MGSTLLSFGKHTAAIYSSKAPSSKWSCSTMKLPVYSSPSDVLVEWLKPPPLHSSDAKCLSFFGGEGQTIAVTF